MMRKALLSVLLALLPLAAMAADQPKGKEGPPITLDMRLDFSDDEKDMERSQEVFSAYMDICLSGFWKAATVQAFVSGNGYTELAPEAVSARIGGREGRGWVKGAPDAADRLELVIQETPRKTCSLWAFDGNAGNYDMTAQVMLSAVGAATGLDISPFETPKHSTSTTINQRGYLMRLLEEGKVVEGAEISMLIIIVDNDPKAPFRVRYARVIN